jgi:CheY-specific phosphatase CheX
LTAAALTFEELGFMLPTEEVDQQQRDTPLDTAVSITFQGPYNGQLVVLTCGEMLPMLAANMLGEDEASEREQRDALGEVANVICGNMLPGLAGAKAVFNLSAPQFISITEELTRGSERLAAEVHLGLDIGRAELRLFLDR